MAAHRPDKTELDDTSLIDAAFDAYLEWREECASVWDAYGCWRGADTREARATFWAYRAALEREEEAARNYALLVGQIRAAAPAGVGSANRGIPVP
jgi:hypothetical protein